MRPPLFRDLQFCMRLGLIICVAGRVFAADTHTVVGSNFKWTYNGHSSTSSLPIPVDDLKIGDIVEIQIPANAGTHGFVTIKKSGGGAAAETKDPVLACGEAADSKPNAVLREIECGSSTKFAVAFKGSLKLQILPNFKDPIDFYCWIHKAAMPGTLKLK